MGLSLKKSFQIFCLDMGKVKHPLIENIPVIMDGQLHNDCLVRGTKLGVANRPV